MWHCNLLTVYMTTLKNLIIVLARTMFIFKISLDHGLIGYSFLLLLYSEARCGYNTKIPQITIISCYTIIRFFRVVILLSENHQKWLLAFLLNLANRPLMLFDIFVIDLVEFEKANLVTIHNRHSWVVGSFVVFTPTC